MNSVLFDGSNDFFENVVACNTTSRTIFAVFQSHGGNGGLFHSNPADQFAGALLPTWGGYQTFLPAAGSYRISAADFLLVPL